jgi:hypothetical protein
VTERRSLKVGSLSTQELRLSLAQRQLLRAALLPMMIACSNVTSGHRANPAIPISFDPTLPRPQFDRVLAELLLRLWNRLYSLFARQGRPRLHLDLIELNMCALGVRATAVAIGHGHIRPATPKYRLVRVRLLGLLENARRRAKRAALKDVGPHLCSAYHERWRKFNRWLRYYALTCRCGKPLVPGLNRPRHRWIVEMATSVAQRELNKRGVPTPEPGELKRLVRKVIREVRRYRVALSIRDLLDNPAGASYLAAYIAEHAKGSKQKEHAK